MSDHDPWARHLVAVPEPNRLVSPAPPARTPGPQSGRVKISAWHRQEAEDARQLLWQLADPDAADLDGSRLAFTLGRLHGAALNLLDIIDTITEP